MAWYRRDLAVPSRMPSVRAISAIDALESGELVDRITSDDEDYLMPPPESKLSLTDDEKRQGAEWAREAGASYVKTSTGFGTGGATDEDLVFATSGTDMQNAHSSATILTANGEEELLERVNELADRVPVVPA